MDHSRERIKCLLILIGCLIFSSGSYALINEFNATRSDHFHLYMDWELSIPLVEWMILFYYAAYIAPFFTYWLLDFEEVKAMAKSYIFACAIGAVVFLAVPTVLGYPRDETMLGFFKPLYLYLWKVDQPHNLFPSIHVVIAFLLLRPLLDKPIPKWAKAVTITFIVGISSSIIFVYQHHLIDLVSGLALAYYSYKFVYQPQLAKARKVGGEVVAFLNKGADYTDKAA